MSDFSAYKEPPAPANHNGYTGEGIKPWDKEVKAEYHYLAEDGRVMATKQFHGVKADGKKDFGWKVPRAFSPKKAGRDGFAWTTDEVAKPLPLYNSHKLEGAKRVWICEGEKDCDSLEARGEVAVTNYDGAGGPWHPSYTAALVAAGVEEIIIPPDNDEAGRKRTKVLAHAMTEAVIPYRVVHWPTIWPTMGEHDDITNAFEDGTELDDILAAALTPEEWLKAEREELLNDPFICRDIFSLSASCDAGQVLLGNEWLRRTDTNTFVSMAGSGKSVAVDGAAVLWSAGLTYLGIAPSKPLRIALFVAEDDEVTIGQQREGIIAYASETIGRAFTEAERNLIRENLMVDFSREHVGDHFVSHRLEPLAAAHEADLVIINPISGYAGGNMVEKGPPMLRGELGPALQRLNAGALVVMHTNKLAKEGMADLNQLYAANGGADMANIPRSILVLNPTTDEDVFRITVQKRKTVGWVDEHGKFVNEHYVRQSGDPTRPAWISLPYQKTRELLKSGEASGGRPAKCAGVHVREVFDEEGVDEIERRELVKKLMVKCQVVDRTASDAVRDLLNGGGANGGVLKLTRSEKRKGGGHDLNYLALAR